MGCFHRWSHEVNSDTLLFGTNERFYDTDVYIRNRFKSAHKRLVKWLIGFSPDEAGFALANQVLAWAARHHERHCALRQPLRR